MATKLKGLSVKKVDFVDEGANQKADIMIAKKKEKQNSESAMQSVISTIVKGLEDVFKGKTFHTFLSESQKRKFNDEIWNYCYALQSSLQSILSDSEVGNPAEEMKTSLQEFCTTMESAIEKWANGELVSEQKVESVVVDNKAVSKKEGEQEEMKIDKSKMTDEERLLYEDLEKRYGADNQAADGKEPVIGRQEPQVVKNDDINKAKEEKEDIYKGLHPAVIAELETLKKFRDETDERELTNIAKKYEIIGKKPEELVPLLKSLKDTSMESYNSMIGVLDASVELVTKSGAFEEIGKSGTYSGTGDGGAWSKIEKQATEIMKSKPDISRMDAIDLACQQNPQLVQEYENNR